MDLGAIERFLESVGQLAGLLQLLIENWWILALAGGLILAVVLVKNAKAILHTIAVAIGIGIVLVVALAIVGMPGEPAVSAPAPVALSTPAATASSPMTLLCAGSALTLLTLGGAAVGGVYLYRRFFSAQPACAPRAGRRGPGGWLPGPNALWGRPSYSHGAPAFYVVEDEGDEIADLILSDPDLWGMSAPVQEYGQADWEGS